MVHCLILLCFLLRDLDLSENILNDSFPKHFGQISNITKLNLRDNQHSGFLPDLMCFFNEGSFCWQQSVKWNFNQSIGQLSKLQFLDVSYNSSEAGRWHHNESLKISTHGHIFRLTNFQLQLWLDSSISTKHHYTRGLQNGSRFPKVSNFSMVAISNAEISDTVPHWLWDRSPMLALFECLSPIPEMPHDMS